MLVSGSAVALSIALFVAMMFCLEGGYRLGRRHSLGGADTAHEGIGAIEAAVFALFGLLLGFSFAGGMSRLDTRNQQIVQEANAIGTAYLRIDLLPSDEQPAMRKLFADYIDARLRVYDNVNDPEITKTNMARVATLQREIWTRVVRAKNGDPTGDAARLLIPALNEMFDITTTRMIALKIHLPKLIFALLTIVALLSGLLAGYSMSKRLSRSWLHMLLYSAVVATTIYTVIDLDYPRAGLIRVDAADNALKELRTSIRVAP